MAHLIYIGESREHRHELSEQCLIGRDPSCTVVVSSPTASRKHAIVQRMGDGTYLVVDLGSAQGTYVDGNRVQSAILLHGSMISVGDSLIRYESARFAEPAPVRDDFAEATPTRRMTTTLLREFQEAGAIADESELRRDYEQLRAAHELALSIGLESEVEVMIDRIIDASFDLLPAEQVAVVLIDPHTLEPTRQIGRTRSAKPVQVPVSQTILGEAIDGRVGILTADAAADERFVRSQSIMAEGLRSAMCVPLLYRHEVLGAIVADSRHAANAFRDSDLGILSTLAAQAGLILKNAGLRDRIIKERQRVAEVLEGLPLGVFLFDAHFKLVRLNAPGVIQAEALLPDCLIGERIEELGGVPLTEIVVRCELGPFDLTLEDGTGRERTFLLTGQKVRSVNEQFMLTVQEVTEKRAREQMESRADRLALVGQLAAGVAHDFNNLLTIILTTGQHLVETLPGREEQGDAHDIVEAGERCASLTKQLLNMARIERGQPTKVNLQGALREAEPLLRQIRRYHSGMFFEIEDESMDVWIDRIRFEQIVMNLVVNAKDAIGREGKIVVSAKARSLDGELNVRDELVPPGEYVELAVTDDGCGMGPETVSRIFEPFFTTKTPDRGTGLGLATVLGLVTQCRGYVWVESELTKGTRFHVLLPQHDESCEPVSSARRATDVDHAESASGTALNSPRI